MKLTKAQVALIADICDMYQLPNQINKRTRLIGAAMVTCYQHELDDRYNDYAKKEYKYAVDACIIAGTMLMNMLPPYSDDDVLDLDPSYEKRHSKIVDEVITILYKELKLVTTTPAYNLLYGFISEFGSFYQILTKQLSGS